MTRVVFGAGRDRDHVVHVIGHVRYSLTAWRYPNTCDRVPILVRRRRGAGSNPMAVTVNRDDRTMKAGQVRYEVVPNVAN